MKLTHLIIASVLLLCLASAVGGSELVFTHYSDDQSTYGPSQAWPSGGSNSEVADDFAVRGKIDRVVADGFAWGRLIFKESIFVSMSSDRTTHRARSSKCISWLRATRTSAMIQPVE